MSENTTAATSPGVPVENPTPFGWMTTADHKRTGRLFIVSSMLFLVLGVFLDLLVRLDLTSATEFVSLGSDGFAQGFTFSREALTLLFLIKYLVLTFCQGNRRRKTLRAKMPR